MSLHSPVEYDEDSNSNVRQSAPCSRSHCSVAVTVLDDLIPLSCCPPQTQARGDATGRTGSLDTAPPLNPAHSQPSGSGEANISGFPPPMSNHAPQNYPQPVGSPAHLMQPRPRLPTNAAENLQQQLDSNQSGAFTQQSESLNSEVSRHSSSSSIGKCPWKVILRIFALSHEYRLLGRDVDVCVRKCMYSCMSVCMYVCCMYIRALEIIICTDVCTYISGCVCF